MDEPQMNLRADEIVAPPIELRREELSSKCSQQKSRLDLLRQYDINIKFLSSGCLVTVGCKSIAFSTIDEAMHQLNEYVKHPLKASEKWNKIFTEEK